jgi:hypothetical protein
MFRSWNRDFDSTKPGTRVRLVAHPGQGVAFSFPTHFARRAADDLGGLLLFGLPRVWRVYISFIVPLKPPFKLGWSDACKPPVNGVGAFCKSRWGPRSEKRAGQE